MVARLGTLLLDDNGMAWIGTDYGIRIADNAGFVTISYHELQGIVTWAQEIWDKGHPELAEEIAREAGGDG